MIKCIIFDLIGTLYDEGSSNLHRDGIQVLKQLKKRHHLVLVTDLNKDKHKLVENLGLYNYFDKVIISKKNKELFKNIINDKKILPSESLVIGDNLENEIKIAKTLNMKYLFVDRKNYLQGPNVISSLNQINSHLGNVKDGKTVLLRDGSELLKVRVYLKEVMVKNNNFKTKAFCKILDSPL